MEETLKQVRAVRVDVGRLDRSDMGKLAITGPDRYSWLQGMVSNDVRRLQSGEVKRLQACILDPTGHVLADVALIDVPEDSSAARKVLGVPYILLETPPDDADRIAALLDNYLIMEEAAIVDVSDRFRCISIQGPNTDLVRTILDLCRGKLLIVEADHTGSGGFDVYSPLAGSLDRSQSDSGVDMKLVTTVGPEAQEILRIEAGIPKYGVDMDGTTLAPEAGIMPTHISLTKGCYVGQEIVARIDSRGHTNRALTGLVVIGEAATNPGEALFSSHDLTESREVGRITSVAPVSPAAEGLPIALGYVRHEHRTPGTWLRVGDPQSYRMVEVEELPFYRSPSGDRVSA